jgi:DNA invertase Pin-like site-specific DNA recombinase
MEYGYARVSTDGQSVAAQVAALTQAGAEAQLHRVMNALDEGDVLIVTRLDRWPVRRATCSIRWRPSPRRKPGFVP